MDDLLTDFVAETREMLEASEGEIIAWEANPADRARLDAIFRFVHTVKGNCGFFDFPRLEALSHAAEDALSDVRADRRVPDSQLVSAVLAIIDRIAAMVDAIEAGEDFPEGGDDRLIEALAEGADEIALVAHETEDGSSADEGGARQRSAGAQRTIRLPVELLDRVMSGVSDMVLARNDLGHRLSQAGAQPSIDGPFERLSSILTDVRDAVTRMRMQRIEHLYGALPRLVRDLSAELGKQVLIDLEGGDVEMDREMIEMIRDPMTHIIRNAIDHGIERPADRLRSGKREMGILSIAARQSGNRITIMVSDDGRGLDTDKIAAKAISSGLMHESDRDNLDREQILQFVFEPGFSTAESVSAVSGRGVGLDVVRDNLERVGGKIEVDSRPGEGTMFLLQLPLTLSIISGLTVETAGQRYAIPQSYVEEIVRAGSTSVDYAQIGDTSLITFRNQRIPCISLADELGLEHEMAQANRSLVMLRLNTGDLFALAVDRIKSIGDIVVKPLPPALTGVGVYGGTTLLDDGTPILLLDIPQMAMARNLASPTRKRVAIADDAAEKAVAEAARAMMVIGHDGRRQAVRLELVQRIDTVSADDIERGEDRDRAVIDGTLLPVFGLPQGEIEDEKVRLLRLSDGSCEVLYAVAQIDDTVALEHELIPSEEPLIEAVTLVDGKQVKLVDGHALFARYGTTKSSHSLRCHVPQGEWSDTILAPLLRQAGYEVVRGEAEDADIAIALDDQPVAGTAKASKILRLRSQPDQEVGETEREVAVYRYDREGVLRALSRLRKGEAA
ncbi:Signal transduction histidine kinase CheA [Altererythrobacter epoxidivorans]|uniref:Chemotaxis protein CheA n=1 Tax=Altererythrobacter epoxidivorans TaxID=361183 RepID=A0A0M4M5L0_9SPHN|nr:chemotaxis protein CheA [Altererythrobacter epoxidivorans]ALE17353.1 Signal transduction histidine kinase CheA [Altererythrobacter epoxidivorans]